MPKSKRSTHYQNLRSAPARKLILARVKDLDWTFYAVAKAASPEVPEATTYAYLAGKRQITADSFLRIALALGLNLVPQGRRPRSGLRRRPGYTPAPLAASKKPKRQRHA